jgi:protein-tyrosine kinase
MNRMEEALRRAHRDLKLPESFASAVSDALDQFQITDPSHGAVGAIDANPVGADPFDEFAGTRPEHSVPAPGPPIVAPGNDSALRQNGSRRNGNIGRRLVTNGGIPSVTVEQYRRLAATLHHAQSTTGIKVVMIASALAGEGKTLTAANLALTLSESYERRVLLIDADLRRPMLHEVFHAPNSFGLNEGLKAETAKKLTVLELSSRLSLLPAGKPDPDPMSVLTSSRMRQVIEEAAAKFEWVLIDTPPVGLLPDAHLLAAMVNVVVLVVQAGRTPVALVQRAVESLARERVIGVVLNLVDDSAISPGGKYEHYYESSYNRADERGGSVLNRPSVG